MRFAIRHTLPVIGAFGVAAIIAFSAASVLAQESTITYPVADLGNCENKSACRTYCDDLAHVNECVAFAEAHGLMSAEEARAAREFARLGGEGPGGCTSKEECETYCEDTAHMRQCLDFAKQAGLMDEEELREAEKVAAYIERGGQMPGGCRGERECRTYCEEDGHWEECAEFAVKAGFMSEKEAEIFHKTGGVGPGGCKGRQCESFCEDEANREQCVAFALEHGLMSEEDKQRMEEGKQKAMEALAKAPPEVLSCIEAALGTERVAQFRRGEGVVSPKLGEVLPHCFREVMGKEQHGPFGPGSAAMDCMRKVFGDDFKEKMKNGELNPGAREQEIRECMRAQMGEGFLNDAGQWERPEGGGPPHGEGMPPRRWGEGDARPQFQEEFRVQYHEPYDSQRREMEARMRAEIEAQMRSGNFDPSKLPADFRPEGAFPPPESFQRPPEGLHPEGMMPPQGYPQSPAERPTGPMPYGPMPQGQYGPYQAPMPEGDRSVPDGSYQGAMPAGSFAPPEGYIPPPHMQQAPPPPPPPPPSDPVSMASPYVANVVLALMRIVSGF